jgi:hypothetical protein
MGRRAGSAGGPHADTGGASDAAVPLTVPEADVFRFDEVDLAAARAHSPPVRRGMALVFDGRGIEISGPEPHRHAFMPWSEVAGITSGRAVVGPDGRTETPVEVASHAGTVRYLVRSDRPESVAMAALESQAARWLEPTATVPTGLAGVPAPVPVLGVPAVAAVGTVAPGETAPPPPSAVPPPAPPPYTVGPTAPPPPYAVGPAGTYGLYDPDLSPALVPPRRTRRTVTLVVALCLLLSGVGLAIGLTADSTTASGPTTTTTGAPASADQRLAEQLMLTKADLPEGWRVAQGGGALTTSPAVQRGQVRITRSLAQCMGITDDQASIVLGGRAADQTAQSSSPIFVAPTSSASAGSALELQTAATVVHSHADQQADFALFDSPKYPNCVATASAAELQLGVDQSSGGSDEAGPATVTTVALPSPDGVRLSGLLMSFTVKAGAATVPVQVESISLGSQRVEASLQVFSIGGQVPSDALLAAFSTFEQRVASGGKSSVV